VSRLETSCAQDRHTDLSFSTTDADLPAASWRCSDILYAILLLNGPKQQAWSTPGRGEHMGLCGGRDRPARRDAIAMEVVVQGCKNPAHGRPFGESQIG
jgi:hypothetical protein